MVGFPLSVPKTLRQLSLITPVNMWPTRVSWWSAVTIAGVLLLCAPALRAQETNRAETFQSFKRALDNQDLGAAERLAKSLVELTELEFGADSRELVNPLTNWGTVAFREGRFPEAETRYQQAIKLLEGQRSGADRLLIRPLHGLGEIWLATGRATEAVVVLRRAVDLSRNLDGLYNFDQLDLVDALIEGYVALGQTSEAEREHQFAYRTAETAYGKNDLRLIEPLDRYARWYESIGRYSTARGLHARALQLAEQLANEQALVGVPALRGLARTWFLEAVYGPEVESQSTAPQIAEGAGLISQQPSNRFNSDGERALQYALEIAKERAPENYRVQGELLTELGDWYLVSGNRKATDTYAEAWQTLEKSGEEALAPLKAPRLLVYRPPPLSTARLQPDNPEDYSLRTVELRCSVDTNGKVMDAQLVDEQATLPEATARSVVFALRRARYAPRLEAGLPVTTSDVSFNESLWLRVSKSDPPAATP